MARGEVSYDYYGLFFPIRFFVDWSEFIRGYLPDAQTTWLMPTHELYIRTDKSVGPLDTGIGQLLATFHLDPLALVLVPMEEDNESG